LKKNKLLKMLLVGSLAISFGVAITNTASAAYSFTNVTTTSFTVGFVSNSGLAGGNANYGATTDQWRCNLYTDNGNTHVVTNYSIPATSPTTSFSGLTPGHTYQVWCVDGTTSQAYDGNSYSITLPTSLTLITNSTISGLTAPSIYGTPVTSITSDPQFTGTVSWAGATSNGLFAQNTTYTATVTLTPVAGYTATGLASNFFSVSGATSATLTSNGGTGNSTIQVVFPATPHLEAVTGLSPSTGYFGQLETITGTNLDRAAYVAVWFTSPTPSAEHDIPSSQFISQSATSITFRLPAINSFATTGTPGSISGNISATSGGTFYVGPANLTAGDSSTNLPLVITSAPSPTIVSPTNNQTITGTVGTPLNFSISLTGTAPFTVSASGALPAGLTMTSAGVISGTPTVAGTTTLTFSAQDALLAPAVSVNGVSFVISPATVTTVVATPVPDPVQQSKIFGIEGANSLSTAAQSVVIDGLFVEKIRNISVGGVMLPQGSWTQSSSKVTVALPTLKVGAVDIQIYNGSAPVLPLLDPEVTAQAAAAPQAPVVANVKAKVIYVQCFKGSHIRIAYGTKPVCPVGYASK